jgi:hypothetical protein
VTPVSTALSHSVLYRPPLNGTNAIVDLRRCHNHKVCEREVRSADELKISAPIESRFNFQQTTRNLGASHDVFEGNEVARWDCNKTKNRNSF